MNIFRTTITRRTFQTFAATLLFAAAMVVCANATTLGNGVSMTATFGANSNTADLLFLFDNTALTESGAPVITYSLYNGGSLLGVFSQAPSPTFLTGTFASSTNILNVFPTTVVPFTSINNGSIAGKIVVTVTGGTITFNQSDLVFYDAKSTAANSYLPLGDLTNISYAVSAPEPNSWTLIGLGLVGLALIGRRIPVQPRR